MNDDTALERYLGGFRGDTVEEVALSQYEGKLVMWFLGICVYRVIGIDRNGMLKLQPLPDGDYKWAYPEELEVYVRQ